MAAPKQRPTMPTKLSIAKWWWHEGWEEAGKYRLNLIDFGEPCCWACGTWRESWTAWRDAALERCHIVPHALGGTNEASNFLLLCKDCHLDSPDTPHREAMLRWAHDRKPNPWGLSRGKVEAAQAISKAVIDHGLDPDQFVTDVYSHLEKCARHFGKDGAEYSTGTVDWAIAEALNEVKAHA